MDLLTRIAIILLVLWLLGLASSYTIGGFIHILLVLALIVILIRVLQGRRPVPWAFSFRVVHFLSAIQAIPFRFSRVLLLCSRTSPY